MTFKLTYGTMFEPPQALHQAFDDALERLRPQFCERQRHFVAGKDFPLAEQGASAWRTMRCPINQSWTLSEFPEAGPDDVDAAVGAAKRAYPGWKNTAADERMRLLRRVADLIEERVYDIAAAVAFEVGKNRMEALGEVQETADFFNGYCDDFERHAGFDHALPDDPLTGFVSRNRSIMKPYGVWAIIAPFNFPFALAGGPLAAALVTGNTAVIKAAPETPWSVRLLSDCLRDAGIPDGVFNFLADPDDAAGPALIDHDAVAGVTFTGSHAVGMQILEKCARRSRPCIAEMGGKNACIVTQHADIERAAVGILRSSFGLSGQKCSALSRLYVEESIADALLEELLPQINALRVGDPTLHDTYMGPVIDQAAQDRFRDCMTALTDGGATILAGGRVLDDEGLRDGYFCAPTLAEAPLIHELWRREMFLPVAMLARVPDKETAMKLTNDSPLGLTAGFYGNEQETQWFFDNVEAGVTYANRPQGATTGAWPGYQPFGGWKGSGSTGKGIASFYYLSQYLREQSQTNVLL